MNYIKKISRVLASTFILAMASSVSVNAAPDISNLRFKSDETAAVSVIIEPGDGSMVPSKESIKLTLEPGEEATVQVDMVKFGTETFSVKGRVKMPSIYNKCGPLIKGDYKIIFTGGKAGGTICIAEKLN